MERSVALFFTIITFVVFLVLSYYGAGVKMWSAVAFATFVALVVLNIFYPPRKMATDNPDFTLFLYAFIEIASVILISVYVGYKSLTDVRKSNCPLLCK